MYLKRQWVKFNTKILLTFLEILNESTDNLCRKIEYYLLEVQVTFDYALLFIK